MTIRSRANPYTRSQTNTKSSGIQPCREENQSQNNQDVLRKHPYRRPRVQAHREEEQSQAVKTQLLERVLSVLWLDLFQFILSRWILELSKKFYLQESSSELARKIKDFGDDVFTLYGDIKNFLNSKEVYTPRWYTRRGMDTMTRLRTRFDNLNARRARDQHQEQKSLVLSVFMIKLLHQFNLILSRWIPEISSKFFAQESSSELAQKIKDLRSGASMLHQDIEKVLCPVLTPTPYTPAFHTRANMVTMHSYCARFEKLHQCKLALEAGGIQKISESTSKAP
jgi:hypothetical protein